jgi:hypothetical protein
VLQKDYRVLSFMSLLPANTSASEFAYFKFCKIVLQLVLCIYIYMYIYTYIYMYIYICIYINNSNKITINNNTLCACKLQFYERTYHITYLKFFSENF